jgi:DNA-directed RNA polymerase subunit alpha
LKFRNFGKKSLDEIEALLHEKGLSFGLDIAKFRMDE